MSTAALHGLPDPRTKPQFYEGVSIKRGIAWAIDVAIIFAMCVVVLPFTAFTGVFFFPLLFLVVNFVYRWFTIAGKSSTWGMRMMGIELRDRDGLRLTSNDAMLHTLGYTISVAFAPLQIVSMLMMLLTDKGQGLTDQLMGTTALNKPAL